MELRKADQADAEKIADLLDQLGYPSSGDFVREKIPCLVSHPDADLVVAVQDGVVLGFISMHFIPQIALAGSFARISYICVDAAARGKGIGKLLEAYCERAARDRGCDRIELHSHGRRFGAHQFYGRLGYEESPKYFMKKLQG